MFLVTGGACVCFSEFSFLLPFSSFLWALLCWVNGLWY
uniref:Uncharacterized protein n=1 Tax=Anguilla anguilla TaxID=7936 RepID=A0A0E9T4Q7_ANGAN